MSTLTGRPTSAISEANAVELRAAPTHVKKRVSPRSLPAAAALVAEAAGMSAILPPLRPVPPDASDELRRRMHREAVAELVRYNPRAFLAPGAKARWWHRLIGKCEYPEVLLDSTGMRGPLVVEGRIKKNLNAPPVGPRPPPPKSQRAP